MKGKRARPEFGRGFRLPGYLSLLLALSRGCIGLGELRAAGASRNDFYMLRAYGLVEAVDARVCLTDAGREVLEHIKAELDC